MQARAGALDELLQSGVLEDVAAIPTTFRRNSIKLAQMPTWKAAGRLKAQIGPGSARRS